MFVTLLGGSLVVVGGTVRSNQDGIDRADAEIFLFDGTSWLEHPSSGPTFLSMPGAVSHQGRLTFYSPTNGWPWGEVWWTDGQSWGGHVEPLTSPPAVKNSVMAIDPSNVEFETGDLARPLSIAGGVPTQLKR